MTKRNQAFLNWLNALSDAFLIFASYLLSLFIRFKLFSGVVSLQLTSTKYIVMAALYSLGIVVVYYISKLYESQRMRKMGGAAFKIIVINGLGTLIFIAILYINKVIDFSRATLFAFWIISSAAVIFKHSFVRLILHYYRKRGYNLRHIAVVGNGNLAFQYYQDILNNPQFGYRISGYFSKVEKEGLGICLGAYETIGEYLEVHDIDELVIALEPHEIRFMKYVLEAADKEGVRVTLIPFFNEYYPAHPTFETIGNSKTINLRATPLDNIGWAIVKRAIDFFGSLVAIIIFAIPMIFIAIGVKLSSPGPVFFKQERVGLNKKPFKMLKFRSMKDTAEPIEKLLSPEEYEQFVKEYKLDNDPRITKIGKFIRKTYIDEIPQFVNVLQGRMSIVGPRPILREELVNYTEAEQEMLYSVMPGMTGYWQSYGHDVADYTGGKRQQMELYYAENASLLLDAKILFKTAALIISCVIGAITGAKKKQSTPCT